MNMLEYLIGVEHEEDKALYAGILGEEEEGWNFPGVVVDGEMSLERMRVLNQAYITILSLTSLALKAIRIFGQDVPDDIGEKIIAPIEEVRRTISDYHAGRADVEAVRAVVKEGQAKPPVDKRASSPAAQGHRP